MTWRNTLLLFGILLFLSAILMPRKKRLPSVRDIRSGNAGENRVLKEIRQNIRGILAVGGFAFLPKGIRSRSVQIDAAIKGVDRIWLLEIKNWSGTVITNSEQWTIKGRRNWKTVNPIIQLRRQCKLLSEETGVPVDGFVVMAGKATTRSGFWPHDVIPLDKISSILEGYSTNKHKDGVSYERAEKAWQHLLYLRKNDIEKGISAIHTIRMLNKDRPKPIASIALALSAVLVMIIKITMYYGINLTSLICFYI